jgi:hypothetical protein
MRKYDLARVLEEIVRDEGSREPVSKHQAKQVLTQAQIKAMARARPKRVGAKPPGK